MDKKHNTFKSLTVILTIGFILMTLLFLFAENNYRRLLNQTDKVIDVAEDAAGLYGKCLENSITDKITISILRSKLEACEKECLITNRVSISKEKKL